MYICVCLYVYDLCVYKLILCPKRALLNVTRAALTETRGAIPPPPITSPHTHNWYSGEWLFNDNAPPEFVYICVCLCVYDSCFYEFVVGDSMKKVHPLLPVF